MMASRRPCGGAFPRIADLITINLSQDMVDVVNCELQSGTETIPKLEDKFNAVCDKRRLQTYRPQTCRLADLQTCRLADLQICGLADTFGTHGEGGGDNCPRRFNPEEAL